MARKPTEKKLAELTEKKVRLDKWLWAARFFKTRSLAKQAIEGGKVRFEGARTKVSKEVVVGVTLQVRQGWDEKTIIVRALSDQRRGAPQAALLYEETLDSIAKREENVKQRRAQSAAQSLQTARPTKKGRRQIQRFKQQDTE